MNKKTLFALGSVIASAAILSATQVGYASDHDDGETDLKSRALNLSDHFVFKSGSDLAFVMYFNPRGLAGKQYFMSPNARYEFHVAKVASKTAAPSVAEDYVFRFEAGPPNASGVQDVTLTVLQNGTVIGNHTGKTTDFASSKSNTGLMTNNGMAGSMHVKWFIGMR